MTTHERFVRAVTSECLCVLLVLSPVLLLLDDLEPGFVRSVMNPHMALFALIVVVLVSPSQDKESSWSKRTLLVFSISIAIMAGAWVWWRLQAGVLGIVIATLAAIAIGAVVWSYDATEQGSS